MNNKTKLKVSLVVLASLAWSLKASAEVINESAITETKDSFGISKFFATKHGYTDWQSSWDNGIARSVGSGKRDPNDPTGYTHRRGNAKFLNIDGKGIMEMGGSQPRIYINPYDGIDSTKPDQFFKNIEGTVYYKRTGSDGANWGGLIMGLRSGPNGHSSTNYSADADYCDANTYYARLRHDGKWDFEKELKHGDQESAGYNKIYPKGLPADQWIGMKYLAYNIENDTQVKLELWIDDTSNGDTSKGGEWRLLGTKIDDGTWGGLDVGGCSYSGNKIILEGGGVAFIRNTGAAKAQYKNFSIREIDPNNRIQVLPKVVVPPAKITVGAVKIAAVSTVASGTDDTNIAENVFDGDLETRWSAKGSGEKLTIDLGTQYYITEIHAAWFKGGERQSHYQIDISDDEETWLTVTDGSSSGATSAMEYIAIKASARYVRFIGLGNSSNAWNSVNELEIFGVASAKVTSGSVELTLEPTVTGSIVASSEEVKNIAANVFDGDYETRWSAKGSGEYLTIDLGARYLVTEIHSAWLKGDERQSHYQIDISNDVINWVTVTDGSSSGVTTALEYIGVNASARYVRLIGLGNSSNTWNSINELKVFGIAEPR